MPYIGEKVYKYEDGDIHEYTLESAYFGCSIEDYSVRICLKEETNNPFPFIYKEIGIEQLSDYSSTKREAMVYAVLDHKELIDDPIYGQAFIDYLLEFSESEGSIFSTTTKETLANLCQSLFKEEEKEDEEEDDSSAL